MTTTIATDAPNAREAQIDTQLAELWSAANGLRVDVPRCEHGRLVGSFCPACGSLVSSQIAWEAEQN